MKCSREKLELCILVSPHKMLLRGDEMESSAPGANERADFMLVAAEVDGSNAQVLSTVYHTTNDVDNTSSASRGYRGAFYPESRLLWTEYVGRCGLRPKTMEGLVSRLWLQRGWPVQVHSNESVLEATLGVMRGLYGNVDEPSLEVESEHQAS